jgi:hypothetical protein
MSREEVADRLDWSTSKLWRVETARSRAHHGDVADLLDVYGVTGECRDALTKLARVMASLRSLAISLPRLGGQASIAAASRHHARDPQRTLKLLQTA